MPTIRKNGKQYDSGDVTVTMFGYEEPEIAEIVYNTEQEHQLNHSLSNKATSYSMGKIEHNGSISMYMTAARRIEKASAGNMLGIKPFDILVSFVNEDNEIVVDKVTAKFKSQGRDVNGEMGLKKQYELLVLDVKLGV